MPCKRRSLLNPPQSKKQKANNFSECASSIGGPGSTLIAAEHTGIQAQLIELDSKYVDLIVRRWQEMTGLQATFSDTERKFAILLEDEKDVLKWFKPAREDFKIYYTAERTYELDFVVEATTHKFLCEPKMETKWTRTKFRRKPEPHRSGAKWPASMSCSMMVSRGNTF